MRQFCIGLIVGLICGALGYSSFHTCVECELPHVPKDTAIVLEQPEFFLSDTITIEGLYKACEYYEIQQFNDWIYGAKKNDIPVCLNKYGRIIFRGNYDRCKVTCKSTVKTSVPLIYKCRGQRKCGRRNEIHNKSVPPGRAEG